LTGEGAFSRLDDASHSLALARFSALIHSSLLCCLGSHQPKFLVIVFVHGCKEPKALKRANAREWLASSGLENAPAPVKRDIEVIGSTLAGTPANLTGVFRGFSVSFQANFRIVSR
jgi:hypothetical protein